MNFATTHFNLIVVFPVLWPPQPTSASPIRQNVEPVVCFVSNVDCIGRLGNLVWPSTSRMRLHNWTSSSWICEYVGTTRVPSAVPAWIPDGSRAVVSNSREDAFAPWYPQYIPQKIKFSGVPTGAPPLSPSTTGILSMRPIFSG